MVLAELGGRITAALRKLANEEKVDEATLSELLKEVCNALVSSDVNVQLVMQLRKNITERVNLARVAAGLNKGRLVREAVYEELVSLLDPKIKPFAPRKGKTNVLMMVGLQGSGKTTTVTKLAYYYKRKGMKVGLVCADTFRAGAYAQLRQNATRAKVPFYGSETETDPAKVAGDGVAQFRSDHSDLVIVDTSGRHKQEEELFVEMQQVAETVKPDLIIFVMDGSIGQAAQDQARAFKERVPVGAVIITKLDGHAKGGGALSAVAATQSPIIFLGTGERIPDLQEFEAERFVQRLLGMGDVKELISTVQDVMPQEEQERIAEELKKKKFTMRTLRDQLQYALKMGPLDKVIQCLPGFSNMRLPEGADAGAKLRNFLNIMDSMTSEELDAGRNVMPLNQSRMQRISRGSGRPVAEICLLMEQYTMFKKLAESAGGLQALTGGGGARGGMPNMRQLAQIANAMPKQVMQQMGMDGLKSLVAAGMNGVGPDDLSAFAEAAAGARGRGGRRGRR